MRHSLVLTLFLSIGLLTGAGCASKQATAETNESETAKDNRKEQRKRCREAKQDRRELRTRVGELESELERARTLTQNRQKLHNNLRDHLGGLIDSGRIKVVVRRGFLAVQMPREVLFESSEFALSKTGKKTLRSVAAPLRDVERFRILVAGHTDNIPVGKKSVDFKNNWELSMMRALTSAEILGNAGVDQKRLAAAGFGEFDPVTSNDSANGRSQNRRVELMLIPDDLSMTDDSK